MRNTTKVSVSPFNNIIEAQSELMGGLKRQEALSKILLLVHRNESATVLNMKPSTLPMIATYFRMATVPVIIALMYTQPSYWGASCAILFIIASITDWLDGYLARKLNSVTDLGKILDPIADKVLVSSILILFVESNLISSVPVLILINRDVIIGGIRSIAASRGLVISAGSVGKWKTTIQMMAIPCLYLSVHWFESTLLPIGRSLIWLSVLLSLISGYHYIKAFNDTKS